MSQNSKASSSAGIYQKQLTDYDLKRLPHKREDEHLLKQSELIDTLKTEFSCPICLDLLKNTMVTECLHRFCAECIKKSIYKGNRECPTCRKKLISKRNLRADPNMDKLIDTVWPDRRLHDALQLEKAQKWSKHLNLVALQRSIAEGMRAQAKTRGRQTSANEDKPTTIERMEVKGQTDNKVKISLLRNKFNDCAAKRLCLRPCRVTIDGFTADMNFDFDNDSTSFDSSSISPFNENTSHKPTSDEGKHTQLPNGLIVDVDVDLFNNSKRIDDKFIGRLNNEAEIGGVLSNVANPSDRQIVEDDSSGFWSASSSSSPFPTNETAHPFFKNTFADCNTNFGIVVSMELALREYVSKTGQLGLVTVEMVTLHELRPAVERFRVKLMHRATVEELREKILKSCKNMAGTELTFYIKTYLGQMTRLHGAETMCTVMALAKRTNFFDYPTIFFATARV